MMCSETFFDRLSVAAGKFYGNFVHVTPAQPPSMDDKHLVFTAWISPGFK
jgi:hypothetical protein